MPGARAEVHDDAVDCRGEELAKVIAMAVTINAWNRFSVATRVPVPRR